LCLIACVTWFATMAVPAVTGIFIFAALTGAGVDLRWWGWLPPLFISAAVAGLTVNGLRDLTNDEAIPRQQPIACRHEVAANPAVLGDHRRSNPPSGLLAESSTWI